MVQLLRVLPARVDGEGGEIGLWSESVLLKAEAGNGGGQQRSLFPRSDEGPRSILEVKKSGTRAVATKNRGGSDNFYSEVQNDADGKGWIQTFKLGPRRSARTNLPEDRMSRSFRPSHG